MSVLLQITIGSGVLVFCILVHLAMIIWIVRKLRAKQHVHQHITVERTFVVSSLVVFTMLVAHTIHVYVWALVLWLLGALPGYEEPIYFVLVTYTTVGYGDVVLEQSFRILGAMASVNGTLAFGLTTAFLVGLVPRLFSALRD